jgi:hypothetical protein
MDLCVIDWIIIKDILVALIGAGVPSAVAIYIFYNWKKQKGSEVIANESKQNIKGLLEIIKSTALMTMEGSTPDGAFNEFHHLKLEYDPIVKSILYLDDCVEINGFKGKMDAFFTSYLELMELKKEFKPRFYNPQFKEVIKSRAQSVQETGMDIVNILIPYSTYQRKVIFKKHTKNKLP